MRYHLAPLFCRPWTLNGISPRLIESHYENNYGGTLNRMAWPTPVSASVGDGCPAYVGAHAAAACVDASGYAAG
jgi:hypothetical protein